ncbi:hypothetical protein GCM10008967_24710 [Bacillus carboniphilus]|uniref:Uncharacterized protein n=1 Tax=Bacillus carboniphilus TaxID=86663 RepID=A0ABN0WCT0_9BACI
MDLSFCFEILKKVKRELCLKIVGEDDTDRLKGSEYGDMGWTCSCYFSSLNSHYFYNKTNSRN